MKVYKTRIFDKWAKKEGIADNSLRKAIDEMLDGLIEADLGGGLVKKRIAKPGQGKSGGYRVLLAFKCKDRAFFLSGFSKNERENISVEEKMALKKLCQIYLNANLQDLEHICKLKKLIEVTYGKE